MNLHSFLPRLNLDPGSEGAGGGGSGEGAGAGGEGAGSPSYVPKADFDRVSGEFTSFKTQQDQRYRELERRFSTQGNQQQQPQSKEPSKPKITDYDFLKGGQEAIDKYNDDLFDWKLHNYEKSKSEREKPEMEKRQQAEYASNVRSQHEARSREYEKENPGFAQRFASANIETYDALHPLILSSDMSPAVVDYFISHPESVQELNSVAMQAGNNWHTAAARYLGRLENKIEYEKELQSNNRRSAEVRPPRTNLKGGNGGSRTPSSEEIMKW